jgi:hypothetical protein
MSATPNSNFPTTPYKPDGGYSTGGLLMLIAALAAVGAVLGYIAHIVSQWFYFIILFPALIGAGIGAVGIRMVNKGRVRNPWLGGLAGFLAGIFAMMAMHYFDYEQFRSTLCGAPPALREMAQLPPDKLPRDRPPDITPDQWLHINQILPLLHVQSFPQFMDWQARAGVTISGSHGSSSSGINLGHTGSYIYWIIEMLIVGAVTFAMVHEATSKPYCRHCDHWKTSKPLGYLNGDPQTLTTALNTGDLATLAAAHPSQVITPLRLSATACDTCLGQNPIDLKLEHITKDKKNNTQTKTLTHVTADAAALPAVAALFAQSPPAYFFHNTDILPVLSSHPCASVPHPWLIFFSVSRVSSMAEHFNPASAT